jgi:hypothetical protein
MPTSQARSDASRLNGSKSRGPVSTQGREISRQNGLKHGLTGQGIVLADEDVSEVHELAAAFMAELDPRSALGQALVGEMATLSVRMKRGARREEEALAGRVRHATEAFDHARFDLAEALFDTLADSPRENLIELRRSPEGVDRLVEGWGELRQVLTRSTVLNDWDIPHQAMLAHLVGLRPDQARGNRADSLAMALRCKPSGIAEPDYLALNPIERRLWARDRLVERIDLEVAKLEEHGRTFDLEAIELDRQGAAEMALFDGSREGTLSRRYESESRRGFFKTLKELRRAEAEFAEVPAPEPVAMPGPIAEPEPTPIARPLGSSCAGTSPTVREPKPAVAEVIDRSDWVGDGMARGLDGRVLAVGRAVMVPG